MWRDALDGAVVSCACVESEQVAGQQEVHDLTAAIRHLRAFASSSADELIPVIGRFVLAIDCLADAISAQGAERFHHIRRAVVLGESRDAIGSDGRKLHAISLRSVKFTRAAVQSFLERIYSIGFTRARQVSGICAS